MISITPVIARGCMSLLLMAAVLYNKQVMRGNILIAGRESR